MQLLCTVVDLSLPTGDANPGNVVAMLKLMGKQQHPFHHEAIMTLSKALVEELSNRELRKVSGAKFFAITIEQYEYEYAEDLRICDLNYHGNYCMQMT